MSYKEELQKIHLEVDELATTIKNAQDRQNEFRTKKQEIIKQ